MLHARAISPIPVIPATGRGATIPHRRPSEAPVSDSLVPCHPTRIAPWRGLGMTLALFLALTGGSADAQVATTEWARLGALSGGALSGGVLSRGVLSRGALSGPALGTLTLDLPAAAAPTTRVMALLQAPGAPRTLDLTIDDAGRAVLPLPLPALSGAAPDGVQTIPLTLVGQDATGAVTFACADLPLAVTPPPPDPGAGLRLARRAETLATEIGYLALLMPAMGDLAEGLDALATDLDSLFAPDADPATAPLDAAQLARFEAVLGAVDRALPPLPGSLVGRVVAPEPARRDRDKFFPADLATFIETNREMNVCPRSPEELTEYIDIGVRARINTDAVQQLLLSAGLSAAALSAQLFNRALGGPAGLENGIGHTVTVLATSQAVLSDYLAGMMPLNLDRLAVTHDPTLIPDDAPPEVRVFRLHGITLHTRSDGWRADKAALDIVLAVATAGTGGVAGRASNAGSAALRRQGDDIALAAYNQSVAQVQRARHGVHLAEETLALGRSEAKIAEDALTALRRPGALPGDAGDFVIGSAERHVRASQEVVFSNEAVLASAEAQLEAALATRTQLLADANRRGAHLDAAADALDTYGNPVLGVLEGAGQGQLTGAGANATQTLIQSFVSRCQVPMTRGADGRAPPHIVTRILEGDAEVLRLMLDGVPETPHAFEAVGPGTRTIEVSLNPRVDLLPLTRQTLLPRETIPVRVGQVQAAIRGLPAGLEAGGRYPLTAWINEGAQGEIIGTPALTWEVDPPFALSVDPGPFNLNRAATLSLPEDLPDGTLITVRIRAAGDYISARVIEPVWVAVGQVRDDEDEGPPSICAPDTSARVLSVEDTRLARRHSADAWNEVHAMHQRDLGCERGWNVLEPSLGPGPDPLNAQSTPEGVIAWGGRPVYRYDSLSTLEDRLAARGACLPTTAYGSIRAFLGNAEDVEVYQLDDTCDTFALLGPTRGLIIEAPVMPLPFYNWYITYLGLD